MNIVSQNYINWLNKLIIESIFKINTNIKLGGINNVFNYINLIKEFDSLVNKTIVSAIREYLEQLDISYLNSIDRKRKYHVKSYLPRTILTVFGEITFNRHFFKSKIDGSSFCYVDRQLGLKKYDYFDPYIRCLVIDKSSQSSISDACKFINDLIGNRVYIKDKFQYLSRQSARNIILSSEIADTEAEELETKEELYIMADEKWISTQYKKDGSKHKKHDRDKKTMVKSIVIFDGWSGIKRRRLTNKKVFASDTENIINQSLDYIYKVYDVTKLKRIYIMGDGAKWIKALPQYYKFEHNTEVYYCLDKYHFKQALHHLAMNKTYEQYLLNYILNDNKKAFEQLTEYIKKENSKRIDTINKKYEYILSNWKDIQNIYKYKMSCPMESQISHNIASLFSSRPKGYSFKMLNKLLEIRLKFINKDNIKINYLKNYNYNKKINITIEKFNFDIFDKYKQFIPLYTGKIYTSNYVRYI